MAEGGGFLDTMKNFLGAGGDLDPKTVQLLGRMGAQIAPEGPLAGAGLVGAEQARSDIMAGAQKELTKEQNDMIGNYLKFLAGGGVKGQIGIGEDNAIDLKAQIPAVGFESEEKQESVAGVEDVTGVAPAPVAPAQPTAQPGMEDLAKLFPFLLARQR